MKSVVTRDLQTGIIYHTPSLKDIDAFFLTEKNEISVLQITTQQNNLNKKLQTFAHSLESLNMGKLK